jgi:BirA family biotin operon repressor/biotin-[acetyl-CoA-carboxylase] ligase
VVSAAARYDGLDAEALARRLGVPRVIALRETTSTLDLAHAAAEAGAPAGTVVVADRQTAGRGRHGRRWRSASGAGVWLTIVERDADRDALPVLPIRLGLAAAPALDAFAGEQVRLKWPNDLYVAAGKLAGVLVEARWQAGALAWIAVGVGVNVVAPTDVERAAGLRAGVSRADVLAALVPALRSAAAARGRLSSAELEAFAGRDLAAGRRCVEPIPGRVVGLRADGALLVRAAGGLEAATAGSLTFAPEPA